MLSSNFVNEICLPLKQFKIPSLYFIFYLKLCHLKVKVRHCEVKCKVPFFLYKMFSLYLFLTFIECTTWRKNSALQAKMRVRILNRPYKPLDPLFHFLSPLSLVKIRPLRENANSASQSIPTSRILPSLFLKKFKEIPKGFLVLGKLGILGDLLAWILKNWSKARL